MRHRRGPLFDELGKSRTPLLAMPQFAPRVVGVLCHIDVLPPVMMALVGGKETGQISLAVDTPHLQRNIADRLISLTREVRTYGED